MVKNFADCTKETCPIEDSIYGYAPNKAANIIFAALFAISFLSYLVQCIRARAWSFLIAMGVGTGAEFVGYIGRVRMSDDAFNQGGFKIQIIALTFAPAFLAAGLYLTLKHIVIVFGAHFSRIRPAWYTWLFIFFDIFSILLQCGGAVIAAVGTNVQQGNNIMIAGLSFQVVTLVIFGTLGIEYAIRVYKHKNELNPTTAELRQTKKFKGFLVALVLAYVVVLIRCSYRVAEMAGGWRNSLMQDEAVFIALDSVMCTIMALSLNIFHPGFIFRLSKQQSKHPSRGSSELETFDMHGQGQRLGTSEAVQK